MTAAGVVRIHRLYLVCPRCHLPRCPLDERLGLDGFLSPQAQRLLCLAGASWSFDRASAHLKEFCGLAVCDNTIRAACDAHGGALRDWQRQAPEASAAFRQAEGDVEFQTDGTAVNTTAGWREMRLSIFAKRHRGQPVTDREDGEQRRLPAPHVRVIQAGIRTAQQLGPAWRRLAARLGVRQTSAVTVIADGARWIWRQVETHLPGAAGVLDIYHACGRLWQEGHSHFGEGTAQAAEWVEARRGELLRGGVAELLAGLGEGWEGVREYFGPHSGHTNYAGRLQAGQAIGSGLVEGACKQVIGRRLKQTGARWKVRRVERMAALCAAQASDQWEAYWSMAV